LVDRGGAVQRLLGGLNPIRGVAYDGWDRIFVAERGASPSAANALSIIDWRGTL
jgi:hypothetical protein